MCAEDAAQYATQRIEALSTSSASNFEKGLDTNIGNGLDFLMTFILFLIFTLSTPTNYRCDDG